MCYHQVAHGTQKHWSNAVTMVTVTLQPIFVNVRLAGLAWPVIFPGVLGRVTVSGVVSVTLTTQHQCVKIVKQDGWDQTAIHPVQMVSR